jgi:HEAT repeat protein
MRRLYVGSLWLAVLWLSAPSVACAQQPEEPTVQGKPLGHWLAALKDREVSRRIEAAEMLAQFGSAARPAVGPLAVAVGDPEEWVRRQAVLALQNLGADARPAAPALRQALKDPCARVRGVAAQTLARLDPETTAPAPVLAAILRDATLDLPVRHHAGYALQEIGPRAIEAAPELAAALRDPDTNVVAIAASVLGGLGADGLPPLVAALGQTDETSRHQIVSALAGALNGAADLEHQRPAAPSFGELRTEAEKAEAERVKKEHAAAERLWQARMRRSRDILPAVVPDLVALLGDRDETVRNTVVSALPRLGPRLAPELTRAMQSPDVRLRLLAAQVLGRADNKSTAPISVLAAVLGDRKHDHAPRLLAAQTLAEFGPRAREALPVLLDTLAETEGDLAGQASSALSHCLPDDLPRLIEALRRRPASRPLVASAIYSAVCNVGGPHEGDDYITGFLGTPPSGAEPRTKEPTPAERARQERITRHQAIIRTVLPDLIQGLADEDEGVRNYLTSALSCAGKLAAPALLAALEGKKPRVRLGAAQALVGMNWSEGERVRLRHALTRWKDDADAQVRAVVAQALAVPIPPPPPTPVAVTLEGLGEQLQSKQEGVRNAAVSALAAKGDQALPVLRPALRHREAVVRQAALSVLGNMPARPKEVVADLVPLLKDSDLGVRLQAMGLLQVFGAEARSAVPAFAGALQDAHPQVRAMAAQALVNLGADARPALAALVRALEDDSCRDLAVNALATLGPDAADAVKPLLTDRDASRRALGLAVLARLGPNARPALPELLKLLHDRRYSLRVQAGNVLAGLGTMPEAAVPELLAALDDDADVRQRAVQLLAAVGPGVVPTLCKILKSDEGKMCHDALAVLQALGGQAKGALPELTALLQNARDARLRLQVLQVLAALGAEGAPAAPALVAALEGDPDANVRQLAFHVVQQLGPAVGGARPALETLLRTSKEAGPRQQAAQLLGRLGPDGRPAVPTLVAALENDTDAAVRLYAIQAIGQLGVGTKDALPILLRVLRTDADPSVRSQAAQAIGQLGADAREAVPVLAGLLQHPAADTRILAASALAGIGNDARPAVKAILPLLPYADATLYDTLTNTLPRLGAAAELGAALAADQPRVREAAARALAQMGAEAKPAAPHLAGALRDPGPAVRLAALQVVVNLRLDARETLPAVVANLADADESVGQTAVAALVALGPDSVRPTGEALRHADARVRGRALAALGQMGEPVKEVLPALLGTLADREVNVRVLATQVVGGLPWTEDDRPAVLARMQAGLQDPDPTVRSAAAALVPRLGTDAVHLWVAMLGSADANVRRAAAVALAGNPQTRAALPALTTALRDTDARVRTQAAITLWQIDQQRQATAPVLIEAAREQDATVRHEAMKGLISLEGFPLVQPRPSFG